MMTSRNITVFITGGTKKLELDEPFLTGHDTTIQLKRATVFWKFRNITTANDNTYFDKRSSDGSSERKTLDEGYWDFGLLKKRLEEEKIELVATIHDNKCLLKNTNVETVDLKNLGKLIGFDAGTTFATGQAPERGTVDMNLGLRYLTIACDLVDSFRNVDVNGGVDTNIAYLPIPPGTRLNSTVSVYNENHPVVLTKEDIVTEMTFSVDSNITNNVEVDVLLNLVVSGIKEYN